MNTLLHALDVNAIRPAAIIQPGQLHPEIIIAAVAARDQVKAKAYARKWDIPTVHTSYQALVDDPAIDAVYIPLPNGLHFEWALKSLQAGKHVLLEKPSTSNSIEAKSLFRSNLLTPEYSNNEIGSPPILLEALHTVFHPAFNGTYSRTSLWSVWKYVHALSTCCLSSYYMLYLPWDQ